MSNPNYTSLLILSSILVACLADGDSGWNYDRDDTSKGPGSWNHNFNQCSGSRNSPIDIVKSKAVKKGVEDWRLIGWNRDYDWTVLDTSYTIKFSLGEGQILTTDGGNLGELYKVLQFHFHWGSKNAHGSEHTVSGKSYPMEVHFVHQKASFPTVNDAVQSEEDDALAAVGFFFEIHDDDNADLDNIVEGVKRVRQSNSSSIDDYALGPLANFVQPAMSGSFYRYFGGLTTPGCQQIVKWTVFETPIKISKRQLAAFRNMDNIDYGTELYRDPQPLGSRTVTYYDIDYSAATSHTVLWGLTFISVIIKFL